MFDAGRQNDFTMGRKEKRMRAKSRAYARKELRRGYLISFLLCELSSFSSSRRRA
jgi:hypothetical protein